jgi:hypothetical protein
MSIRSKKFHPTRKARGLFPRLRSSLAKIRLLTKNCMKIYSELSPNGVQESSLIRTMPAIFRAVAQPFGMT